MWKYFTRHDRASAQDSIVRNAIAQLRAWRGKILFGTDLGAVDPDPSEEYALMAEAGMSFSEILASLTTGRVAAGQPADLAVWKDAPAAVKYTLRGGKIIYRAGSGGPRSHDQQP